MAARPAAPVGRPQAAALRSGACAAPGHRACARPSGAAGEQLLCVAMAECQQAAAMRRCA